MRFVSSAAANQDWGKGTGYGTTLLYVRITTDESVITDIEVLLHGEASGISNAAIKQIPAAIIAAQSVEVDFRFERVQS